jgi:hypothetical protein
MNKAQKSGNSEQQITVKTEDGTYMKGSVDIILYEGYFHNIY